MRDLDMRGGYLQQFLRNVFGWNAGLQWQQSVCGGVLYGQYGVTLRPFLNDQRRHERNVFQRVCGQLFLYV